jgi:hypothetical protein
VADLVVAQANEWRADLIVIGSHGRRGFDRAMMGSDAERIVRCAPGTGPRRARSERIASEPGREVPRLVAPV